MNLAPQNIALTGLSPGDKIEVIKSTGERQLVLVVSDPQTKADIINEQYGHLIGQPITLTQAAKKYDVPRGTVEGWVYKNDYIKIIDEDAYPKVFDESDIAYCAGIYHERKELGTGFYGAPLLDDDGLPYELKHPGLAKYRRRKKSHN